MISAFSKGGAITVNGRDSLPSVGIGIDSNGGRIAVYGHDLILTPVVEISTNPDGGSMNIRHASGGMAITMGIADTEKEGFVQVQRKGQKGGIQLVANEYGGSMEISTTVAKTFSKPVLVIRVVALLTLGTNTVTEQDSCHKTVPLVKHQQNLKKLSTSVLTKTRGGDSISGERVITRVSAMFVFENHRFQPRLHPQNRRLIESRTPEACYC